MKPQPYTKDDLDRGEQIVRELHGLKGFEAWAERIAKALAEERERSQRVEIVRQFNAWCPEPVRDDR